VFLPKRTDADFQGWRRPRDWTVEKYRRFDRGEWKLHDWRGVWLIAAGNDRSTIRFPRPAGAGLPAISRRPRSSNERDLQMIHADVGNRDRLPLQLSSRT
jgi:hypothetical protein